MSHFEAMRLLNAQREGLEDIPLELINIALELTGDLFTKND